MNSIYILVLRINLGRPVMDASQDWNCFSSEIPKVGDKCPAIKRTTRPTKTAFISPSLVKNNWQQVSNGHILIFPSLTQGLKNQVTITENCHDAIGSLHLFLGVLSDMSGCLIFVMGKCLHCIVGISRETSQEADAVDVECEDSRSH